MWSLWQLAKQFIVTQGNVTETFDNTGGLFTKVNQIINASNPNAKCFRDTPGGDASLIEFLHHRPDISADITTVDSTPVGSGSIAHVFRVYLHTGESRVFKIKHKDLTAKLSDQINMISLVSGFIRNMGFEIGEADQEYSTMLLAELAFRAEAKNQMHLHYLWKNNPCIYIPKAYPEWSSNDILCSEYIADVPLTSFIQHSQQNDINTVAFNIATFVFHNHLKHDCFYTDIHYGNFLITLGTNRVTVVDFGAVKYFEADMINSLRDLYTSIFCNDRDLFASTVTNLGMITTLESIEMLYLFYRVQMAPWITEDVFVFTDDWLSQSTTTDIRTLLTWKLPKELLCFMKITFGMNRMFTHMKVANNFSSIMKSCLNI